MGVVEGSTWAAAVSIPGVEQLEPIGRGGFATVYKGWQPEFHRSVAVKVLDPAATASADRFSRELRAMGAVSDHPNVVPVYDAGTVDGRGYLVMPLLAGGTLDERIRSGPIPPAEVLAIGRGVASALAAAHRAGLLHRDVKPANVLFTSYGEPKLADFGIARFADAKVTQDCLLLTVGFAAPEIIQGEPATAATDVYSLGATLHAALRGGPPFAPRPDEAPLAAALRVVNDPPADLRAGGVPPALAAVVERAMAKDPAARFASADIMREALDSVDLAATTGPSVSTATVAIAAPTTQQLAPAATEIDLREGPWPEPGPARVTATEPRAGRGAWILGALLAASVLIAAVVVLSTRGDGDRRNTSRSTGVASAPGLATTKKAPSATTARSETTKAAAPVAVAGSPAAATRSYYASMGADHIDEGWRRLSAAYQARVGRSSYEGFWRTIRSVEVLDVKEDGSTAVVDLRYTRNNGTTSVERAALRFVPGPSPGSLLIDDFRAA